MVKEVPQQSPPVRRPPSTPTRGRPSQSIPLVSARESDDVCWTVPKKENYRTKNKRPKEGTSPPVNLLKSLKKVYSAQNHEVRKDLSPAKKKRPSALGCGGDDPCVKAELLATSWVWPKKGSAGVRGRRT